MLNIQIGDLIEVRKGGIRACMITLLLVEVL